MERQISLPCRKTDGFRFKVDVYSIKVGYNRFVVHAVRKLSRIYGLGVGEVESEVGSPERRVNGGGCL